jgi:hypothetical protein
MFGYGVNPNSLGVACSRRIAVAVQCKVWVSGLSFAGIACSNPTGAWMSFVSVVCFQVEIASG